jgi:hypothetical protein
MRASVGGVQRKEVKGCCEEEMLIKTTHTCDVNQERSRCQMETEYGHSWEAVEGIITHPSSTYPMGMVIRAVFPTPRYASTGVTGQPIKRYASRHAKRAHPICTSHSSIARAGHGQLAWPKQGAEGARSQIDSVCVWALADHGSHAPSWCTSHLSGTSQHFEPPE